MTETDFCKLCHSLLIYGNCTNKKCKNYISRKQATYEQINYIEGLLAKLNEDGGYDYKIMNKIEASKIIKALILRVELGEER